MTVGRTSVALAMLVLAGSALAADYPLSGQFLSLRSAVTSRVAGIRLGATGDAPLEGVRSIDPIVSGGLLEMGGEGILGADAPAVPLPGENWRGLGDPPGSRGFRYFDSSSRFGVRKVAMHFGTRFSLSIYGGGRAWPYRTSGVPGAVIVRLRIGAESLCATFATFERGRGAAMRSGSNPAPATCQYESGS